MTRALVVKELRECAAAMALAALAAAFVLSDLWGVRITPWNRNEPVEFPRRPVGKLSMGVGGINACVISRPWDDL